VEDAGHGRSTNGHPPYERSELNKSALYLEVLPLFMRQAISIPDHPRLLRELRLLERRTSRIGKDIVDHGKGGSDDYWARLCKAPANALAYRFRLWQHIAAHS
jgi:hypothetical protein